MRPVAHSDGHYLPRLIDEPVPGAAALIDDVFVVLEDAARGVSSVSATTRSTSSPSSGAMPGGLLLSRRRPSTPSDMKRPCHRQTQGLDFPVASMIATVPRPSPLINMIFARHTCFCGEVGAAMMASSRDRSAAVTSNVIPVRILNRCTIYNRWESQNGIFCLDQSTSRVGSVCLNSFGRLAKWISASITLRLWPGIFSSEIDVFPSERRDMGQQIGR